MFNTLSIIIHVTVFNTVLRILYHHLNGFVFLMPEMLNRFIGHRFFVSNELEMEEIYSRDRPKTRVGRPTPHFYEDFIFQLYTFFHGNHTPRQRNLCVSKPDKCGSPGLFALLKNRR